MPSADAPPRSRFGRILVLGSLLVFAAAAGLVWPRIWEATTVPGGALEKVKKKWDMWRGFATWKDRRIKAVVNGIDGTPPKPRARH